MNFVASSRTFRSRTGRSVHGEIDIGENRMAIELLLNGNAHTLSVVQRKPQAVYLVDTVQRRYIEHANPDGSLTVVLDGQSFKVWRVIDGDRIHVRLDNETYELGYEDAVTAATHHAGGDELRAAMPGLVIDRHFDDGDIVAPGDVVLTLESMKMQITVTAPRDATILKIHVSANETFDKGALLISLQPSE
jgi:biotin carboxyl carrier protein